jgi:hypothetical protein
VIVVLPTPLLIPATINRAIGVSFARVFVSAVGR